MVWMLKNSAGKPDSMFTFAVGGFLITALSILVTLVDSVSIGDASVNIGSPDSTLVMAFLGATLLAYVNRRNKKLDAEIELKKVKLESGIVE